MRAKLIGLVCALPLAAQTLDSVPWATRYVVTPNIVYLTANNYPLTLDVYHRTDSPGPHPTLIYFHGGGWVRSTKEIGIPHLIPYLEMGWNVVNVNYRLGGVSLAPAAVEDCRCALRWIVQNGRQYGLDPARLVTSGHSAGGHLALMAGMLRNSDGFDEICPYRQDAKVAAVVNWFGITDVAQLLEPPGWREFAAAWLGSQPNRVEIARRASPLTYVRKDLPPIITIHGEADPVVPFTQAVRLQEALARAGVTHKLISIPEGKHGGFPPAQTVRAYGAITEFLAAAWK